MNSSLYQKDIKKLMIENAQLENKLSESKKDLHNLQVRITQLEHELNLAHFKIDKNELLKTLRAQNKQIDELKSEVKSLEWQLTSKERDVEVYRKQYETHRDQVNVLNAQIRNHIKAMQSKQQNDLPKGTEV